MMVEMKDEAPENEITTDEQNNNKKNNIIYIQQPENIYRHI